MKGQKLIPLVVIAAGLLAYQNSFTGPFVFDDLPSIRDNPTIRHLWPTWEALSPPHGGLTVAGRPLVNFSLAINYALGGLDVRGYHAVNLAIHILAGLALFGIVRRTLLQPMLRERFGGAASGLALAIAVLWTVHPLQTESVTYIVQRAESIMGLFYLLTLYCFIRGAESPRSRLWYGLCAGACGLGMTSKEVMVSAPLMVVLYDRTFVSGSFREAWRRRRSLYLALGSTWILLGYLVATAGGRGGSAGFGANIIWWQYALTQTRAITHYLWLSVWPHPLVFDYGEFVAIQHITEVLPSALVVVALAASALFELWHRPAIGFVGAWFFMILAPTSSVVPIGSQLMAEHRMYLALAAVVAMIVVGAFALGKRLFNEQQGVVLGCVAGGAVVVLLASLTIQRNRDYDSGLTLWQDTVQKRPNNPGAHNNLGIALFELGRRQEAIGHYEQALRIKPDYAEAHNNLGNALTQLGRLQEAIGHYEQVLRIKPDYDRVHYNLGIALAQTGKNEEAIAHYELALRLRPDYAEAHNNLGNVLLQEGKFSAAVGHYEQALRFKPDYAEAHYNLGTVLLKEGKINDAIGHFEQALRFEPDYAEAHYNLGMALAQTGRIEDAIAHYEQALRSKPDYARAHFHLGLALSRVGRLQEAMGHWEQALRIQPDYAEAHYNLGTALAQTGKIEDAIAHYKQALRIQPDYAEAHNNLGNALLRVGKVSEAIAQYEQSLQSDPKDARAHYNLGVALEQAGKVPEAIGHFEQALRIKPDFSEARNKLAQLRAGQ